MGVIIDVSCASCGKTWNCRTGSGIMHGELGAVKSLFPMEIRQKLDRYEAETELPLFDFGYRLAVCEHCKSVESVPVIKLLDKGAEYAGPCGKCGKGTELIENIGKARCPVCREASLSEEETGLWD